MPTSSTRTPRPSGRAGDFYTFVRTLEVYKEALKGETRLILTTDSGLLRMIKKLEPAKTGDEAQPHGRLPPDRPRTGPFDRGGLQGKALINGRRSVENSGSATHCMGIRNGVK